MKGHLKFSTKDVGDGSLKFRSLEFRGSGFKGLGV